MILATFLLTSGLIDDLLTRKVHNGLFVGLLIVAALSSLLQGVILQGVMGLGLAVALLLPLYAFRVLGAGDVKLMMAFGMATSMEAVLFVSLYGLVWAAVFGLTKMALTKNWGAFLAAPKMFLSGFHWRTAKTLAIPMTFPLLLGWLSFLTLKGVGA